MCLLPVDSAEIEDKESSDDSIDEKVTKKKGNLESSKKIDAYIRVAKFAQDLGSKPKAASIIRQSKVSF